MTKQKINVLLLTKFFPDKYRPDYAKLVFNLAKGLKQHPDINLIILRPFPSLPKWLCQIIPKYKNYSSISTTEVIDGIEIHYIPFYKFPLSHYYFEDIFIENITTKFLSKIGNPVIDVIYCHWPYPEAVSALKIGQINKSKTLLHFHASCPEIFKRYKRIRKKVENVLIETDKILFVSKGIQEQTKKYFELNSFGVVHNGIDNRMFFPAGKEFARNALSIPLQGKIFLTVGYLKPQKGINTLLEAVKLLHQENKIDPLAKFYIIGEGEELDRLLEERNKLGLESFVSFLKSKPYSEIPMWMQASDVFVLPSYQESFGQVFVEAMMCGTPAIGTNVGGIPEIIVDKETGFIVPPKNARKLADAIYAALHTEWNSEKISLHAQKFSLKNMVFSVANELIMLSRQTN